MNKRFNIFCMSVAIIFLILFSFAVYKRNKYNTEIYNEGVYLLQEGNYTEAIETFSNIPNYIRYKDIPELLNEYQIPVCPNCGLPLE